MKKKKTWGIVGIILLVIGIGCYGGYHYFSEKQQIKKLKEEYGVEDQDIVGITRNYLKLSTEEESDWTLTNEKTEQTYQITTKDSKGSILGLENGSYILSNDQDSQYTYRLIFDEFHRSYSLRPRKSWVEGSSSQGGAIVLLIQDEEGNPQEDIEVDLFDSNGEKILTASSNKDGYVTITEVAKLGKKIVYITQEKEKEAEKIFIDVSKNKVIGIHVIVNENGVIVG